MMNGLESLGFVRDGSAKDLYVKGYATCHGKKITLDMRMLDVVLPNEGLSEYVVKLVMIRKDNNIMYLLTNINDKSIVTKSIYDIYVNRWKIEEYFKFKKQKYNIENIMTRSLNSIKTILLLVSIITGYLSIISDTK